MSGERFRWGNKAGRRAYSSRLLALFTILALLGSACGGGEEEPDAAGDEVDLAAFCESGIEGEQRFQEGPEVEDQGEPTEEALEEFRGEMEPLIEQIEANTPEEIESEVGTVLESVREALDTGDPSVLESEEFFEAEAAFDEYIYENCEFDSKEEFVAVNYAYQELPETLSPGQVAFRMDNQGSEVHEAVLFKIQAGETREIVELLDLPEDQVEQVLEFRGATFAPPATDATLVADLDAGRYAVVCFIPVGTTSMDQLSEGEGEEGGGETASPGTQATPTAGTSPTAAASPEASPTGAATPAASPGATPSPAGEGEEGAPPHFTQGMVSEFTVG